MMTTLFLSHTFASLPNSRLNTPIVPGPHTSCVIRTSACTQTFSPAPTVAFPAARAKIFSVNVIKETGNVSPGNAGCKLSSKAGSACFTCSTPQHTRHVIALRGFTPYSSREIGERNALRRGDRPGSGNGDCAGQALFRAAFVFGRAVEAAGEFDRARTDRGTCGDVRCG